jgi:hypothetical protein
MQQQAGYRAYRDKNLEEVLAKIKAGTRLKDELKGMYKYKETRDPRGGPVDAR